MKKNSSKQVISLQDVTEELVIEYLCTHPEFFQMHEDILQRLQLSHPCGAAVSLIERQVQLLREKNQQVNAAMAETVAIAKENQQLFINASKLTLSLLAAVSAEQLLESLVAGLQHYFAISHFRLGLIKKHKAWAGLEGAHLFFFRKKADTVVSDILQSNKSACKPLVEEQKQFLFADQWTEVASTAVIPLGNRGAVGLLALASTDRRHFKQSMDTLFLDYLGSIIACLIGKFV